ncbi:hypothetical protein M0804_014428 [Polistes exclamans]|nr:hypothetical protein M0804_014430 [Polistes exclamans]KAI4475236.1 hypothetical protein M0804_014428 [Polistes exclamans]
MSFFGWKKGGSDTSDNTGRNLQDGLFQIASQACHILVQVNNTHNVSYGGGSNNVTNVAYSKYSTAGGSTTLSTSTSVRGTSSGKPYPKYAEPRTKDQDVVVLLPHRKSRTPKIKHKLSVC